jgi:hypothetical protein
MAAYLVFFVRDPVDDALATSVTDRLRGCPGAGWFDDPGAESAAERTTGGYVRVEDPSEPLGLELLDVARTLSADLSVAVEVQWREAVHARIDAGTVTAVTP